MARRGADRRRALGIMAALRRAQGNQLRRTQLDGKGVTRKANVQEFPAPHIKVYSPRAIGGPATTEGRN